MGKTGCILIVIGAFLLLAIPYPMIVARKCTVMVVDGTAKPWPGVKVGRGRAFGSPETLEDGYTEPAGGSIALSTSRPRTAALPVSAESP
jgi:hypothetical protein